MTKYVLCGILLLLAGTELVPAQSKVGTTVGQFLLIEPSARIAAMGNAGVTVSDEIQASYYNPASIGLLNGSGVQFTHSPWFADITYDYFSGVLNLGTVGNLYASVTALNSGEIDVRTVDSPLGTGERYTVTDLAYGLGYGRKVSDKFSLGIQFTYMQETIWHSSLSAFAFNVGTIYQVSDQGLRIGASISNWGTRGQFSGSDLRVFYDQTTDAHNPINGDNRQIPGEIITDDFPLPILFRVGVGLPVTIDQNNKVYVAADAFHPSDNTESVSFGAEWLFFDTFALRGGFQHLWQTDREGGLTLGAGLQYAMNDIRLYFDYGWADQGRLSNTQRLSLGVMF